MKSWKANWVLNEAVTLQTFSKNRAILKNYWSFYAAIFLKIKKSIWANDIVLKFKNGNQVIIDDFMSLFIYHEIFVQMCYDLDLKKKNPLVVDVGGNIGHFVLRMKQNYPDAKVLSYEPFQANYKAINRIIALNELENINTFSLAVGGTARKEKLYIHPKNHAGHSLFNELTDDGNFVEIEIIDLDTVIKELKGETCDLLKLDCEGSEYEIILSMDEKKAAHFDRIIFEATHELYDVNKLTSHLSDLGYKLTYKDNLYSAIKSSN